MRAGACSVHQTLSPEASSVLQHSLLLARRRGHAQLTPLHVAATLLTSSSRFASTLKSSSSPHPHPLRFRALELCLNVSLNRLPATGGHHLLHSSPSLSNALVAALKRAQAHQKRSEENCFLSTKVDLDQLIMSILDDPSVSRVMREAGFSSTSAKSNLEDRRKNSVMNYGRLDFWRSEQNPTMEDTRDSRILSKGSLHCRKEGQDNVLRCCPECLSNFEKEYASAQLPYCLKIHANDSPDNKEGLLQLTRKYNSLCQSLHGPCYYQSPMDSLKSMERIRVRTTLSLGNPANDSVDLRNAIRETAPWKSESIQSYCGSGSGNRSYVVPMKLIVHESKHGRKVSDSNRKRRRNSSSSYAFDLNVRADEDDEGCKFSPVLSDLTREVSVEQQSSVVFVERIRHQLVFNRDSDVGLLSNFPDVKKQKQYSICSVETDGSCEILGS